LKGKHYLEDDEETRKRYFKKHIKPTNIPEGSSGATDKVMTIPIQDRHCPIWDAAAHIHSLKRNVITVPRTIEALKTWVAIRIKERKVAIKDKLIEQGIDPLIAESRADKLAKREQMWFDIKRSSTKKRKPRPYFK
jgi:hypothetical protein